MIYDKIKIYVNKRVANILNKDADSFEFYKKDGITPNKNSFLTSLLLNYFDEFRKKQQTLYNKIKSSIQSKAKIDENSIQELCFDIAEKVNKEFASDETEKFDCLISLKPTKESQPIIDYIEKYLLNGSSLSEYFRNMFSSYASYTQDKREEIIFKPQFDSIGKAIKEGKKVFITSKNAENSKSEIAPYAFARSKEEMHIYVLAVIDGKCYTLRLSRIVSATILVGNSYFSDENIEIFSKMQKYGPQFNYKPQNEDIVVRLTKEGIRKLKLMYVHRPVPKKIDGDLYYYDCSTSQVISYFERFGPDAYVVSPKNVQSIIFNFHRLSLKNYRQKQNK